MNQSVMPYHHGDLRNCAIIAAAELIETIGSYDITITQVAKRVGVSSPALYRHFKDKDALLTAVRELAHIGIMQYTTDAQDSVALGTIKSGSKDDTRVSLAKPSSLGQFHASLQE